MSSFLFCSNWHEIEQKRIARLTKPKLGEQNSKVLCFVFVYILLALKHWTQNWIIYIYIFLSQKIKSAVASFIFFFSVLIFVFGGIANSDRTEEKKFAVCVFLNQRNANRHNSRLFLLFFFVVVAYTIKESRNYRFLLLFCLLHLFILILILLL